MLTQFLLALIRLYQRCVSPLLGDCCRFEPSCSRYASLCLQHHGAARGSWLSLKRLARCNPLCAGGIDLPPMPAGAPLSDRTIDWARLSRRLEAQSGIYPQVPGRLVVVQAKPEPGVTGPMPSGAHRS